MTLIKSCFISLTVILSVVANEIPSPPEILEVKCKRWTAILSWSPTGEAPVTEYIVQYKTNWSPNEWLNYEFASPLKDKSVRLILSPWTNYTFRVIAKNDALVSQPSSESQTCETEEDVPYKNPEQVYGRGNGPNNLVISWKPMQPIDQNAPGFHYRVYWRQSDVVSDNWHEKIISEWEQHRLLVENLPKLRPFRIKVEAHNSMGMARVEAQEVIGYSDEDKPDEAPESFRVLQIIDGKSAKLAWEPVKPTSLNGHFKGYKVQSWTEEDGNKTEKIVPANITTALIDIFTPGQVNMVEVLAFNGAFDGPPSNTIEITMPEDVYPDQPSFVWTRVTDQSNKAVIRITPQPNFTNKNPGQKIFIQYRRKGIDTLDQWVSTFEEKPEDAKQQLDLMDLEFDTFYEVRVVAKSGKLESYSNISTIDTHSEKWPKITTTTIPTTQPEPTFPPPTEEVRIPTQSRQLEPVFDHDNRIPTYTEKTESFGEEGVEEGDSFAKTPWFIALLIVLAFICAFVGVFIFIKRRKNGGETRRNSSRVVSDKIRDPKNNSEPNENNHFIAQMDSNARNGNAGHDEVDEYDEDEPEANRVYKSTTVSKA